MVTPPLPDDITLPGEPRLVTITDMLSTGELGEEFLIVTEEQLQVYARELSRSLLRLDIPFAELSDYKSENLVGGGRLIAKRADVVIEIVRYTAREVGRFASIAGLLEKWQKGEEALPPEDDREYCAKCGLLLERGTSVCQLCRPGMQTINRLISFMKPIKWQALGLTGMAMLGTIIGLIPPYLQKPLMDKVLAPKFHIEKADRLSMLLWLTLALIGVRVLGALIGAFQSWLSAWVGNRITHDIRTKLYKHLQYLSLGFFDKRQIGSVISRVNQDTNNLQQFLIWGAQDLIINVLLVVGIGAMLFAMSWKLALIVVIPTPIVTMLAQAIWMRMRINFRRMWRRWSTLNNVLTEGLNGLRIVKAFAQEKRAIERFDQASIDVATSAVTVDRSWAFLFSGISLLMMMGTMLVWYFGGVDVLNEHMSLGTLMAFITYVAMFYQPVGSLSSLLNWSSRAMTAAERIFEVLDTEPEVKESENPQELPHIVGTVEFTNVTFGYEPHRPVLKGVSFKVEPGEMIGLVGHSGAGKSTIINLLCRFYDCTEGSITIDGVDIKDLKLEEVRKQIGLVPQDTFLFAGTIADNITYAKPNATREEIVEAARVANAHEFIIRRPDGYETLLGEGGQGLSGGEKQRIAIARAVLHNPKILILDEATSQVDIETEKQIQEAIDRLVKGRTTFAIAHRLSTLKNADRLIVLKQGEVVEVGSHTELQENEEGEFFKLVKMYQEISRVRGVAR